MPFDIWMPPKPAIIIPATKELYAPRLDPKFSLGLTMLARTSMLRLRRSVSALHGPITFVGSATASAADGGNATITLPAMLEGDMVIVLSGTADSASALSGGPEPSGYTLIANVTAASSSANPRLVTAYKFMDASPDSSVTTFGNANSLDATAAVALVFRGVDSANPFAATAVSNSSGSNGQIDPSAITPTVDNACIVAGGVIQLSDSTPGNSPTNYLPSTPVFQNQVDTRSVTTLACYRILSGGSGASEDPGQFSSLSVSTRAVITIALRPLPS